MIRYALSCSDGHRFEAWFRSAADFDNQQLTGLLSCPICGDVEVGKALMAPSVVSRGDPAAEAAPPSPVGPVAPAEAPTLAAGPAEMIERLRELKSALLANSEHVGPRFAEEARRIHYGEAPARLVHGEASTEEAKKLIEEGVGIMPIPILPDERN
jgi:hypothetical protein